MLVLIHGLGQSSNDWNEVIKGLDNKNVICPNLSEYIGSNKLTYELLLNELTNRLNEIEEPIDLCGLSLGGILALNYAIKNPSKIKSLVLIGAQHKVSKNLLKLQNLIIKFVPSSSFNKVGLKKKNIITLHDSMMDIDMSDLLKDIKVETLVVCGSKDTQYKKASEELAMNIPNSRLLIIDNVGHEINTENPLELSKVLNEFYNNLK